MMPDQKPIMEKCFVCEIAFQRGPHIYKGRMVEGWSELVCDGCITINHDGIVPSSYPHLLPALRAKGIQPKLNANGFIVVPVSEGE